VKTSEDRHTMLARQLRANRMRFAAFGGSLLAIGIGLVGAFGWGIGLGVVGALVWLDLFVGEIFREVRSNHAD